MIPDGRSKGMPPWKFDPRQLEIGARHEMEHTTDPVIARRIAADHLAERPDYYTKLRAAGLNPLVGLSPRNKADIQQIVGNLHVGASDEEVKQHILSRIHPKQLPKVSKGLLNAALRHAVRVHHKNRDLYSRVMGGRLNPTARRNSTKGSYPFTEKEEHYRTLPMSSLLYAKKDAYQSAQAMRRHDPAAEAWYMDDVATILTEIKRRQKQNPLTSEEESAILDAAIMAGKHSDDTTQPKALQGFHRGRQFAFEETARAFGPRREKPSVGTDLDLAMRYRGLRNPLTPEESFELDRWAKGHRARAAHDPEARGAARTADMVLRRFGPMRNPPYLVYRVRRKGAKAPEWVVTPWTRETVGRIPYEDLVAPGMELIRADSEAEAWRIAQGVFRQDPAYQRIATMRKPYPPTGRVFNANPLTQAEVDDISGMEKKTLSMAEWLITEKRRLQAEYTRGRAHGMWDIRKMYRAPGVEFRNNPGEADSDAANELELFIINDSDLYHSQHKPIIQSLMRKRAAGIFDPEKAVKFFMYLAESGAKKYAKEFGEPGRPWHVQFSVPTRLIVARSLRDKFVAEADLGNYDQYIPKKYQKSPSIKKEKIAVGNAYQFQMTNIPGAPWMTYWVIGIDKPSPSGLGLQMIHFSSKPPNETQANAEHFSMALRDFAESKFPHPRANPRVTQGRYIRHRVASPAKFDPRSFRTVTRGGKRIVIGCPKGSYSPGRGLCKVGTRAQSVLYPMKPSAIRTIRAANPARHPVPASSLSWKIDGGDLVTRTPIGEYRIVLVREKSGRGRYYALYLSGQFGGQYRTVQAAINAARKNYNSVQAWRHKHFPRANPMSAKTIIAHASASLGQAERALSYARPNYHVIAQFIFGAMGRLHTLTLKDYDRYPEAVALLKKADALRVRYQNYLQEYLPNPLTLGEAGLALGRARQEVTPLPGDIPSDALFSAGSASGMADMVQLYGPRRMKGQARGIMDDATNTWRRLRRPRPKNPGYTIGRGSREISLTPKQARAMMANSRGKTKLEELEEYAKEKGLWVATWSPGDGVTRYRFFNKPGNSYFGPGDGIYTALGLKNAWQFAQGYAWGRGSKANPLLPPFGIPPNPRRGEYPSDKWLRAFKVAYRTYGGHMGPRTLQVAVNKATELYRLGSTPSASAKAVVEQIKLYGSARDWKELAGYPENPKRNPILQTIGILGNPRNGCKRNGDITVPWKAGQKIPVEQARAWVAKNGTPTLKRQFEEAYQLQTKANRKPQFVRFDLLPIGDPDRLEMVTAMAHYGTSDETLYLPPKGSKKGRHLYSHKWGEGSGRKKPVELLAAPSGGAVVQLMNKGQTVGDWMRG